MNKRKILILNYEYPPLGGGAGNATKHLLKEYAGNREILVDLITSSTNKFKIEKIAENITIHFLDIGKRSHNLQSQSAKDILFYSVKAFIYSRKLNKKSRYDLCHAFFGIPCGVVAVFLNISYIVSLRGSDVPLYNPKYVIADTVLLRFLSKFVWRKAKFVIANSIEMRKHSLGLYSNLGKDILIIPNGIDNKRFKPSNKVRRNKVLRIISVGRLSKVKGFEYLISALKGLSSVKLTLVGDGPLRKQLESLAESQGVEVDFVGQVDHKDVVKFLQESDIYVQSSINEGMSNSALEAMACGLPLIMTNVGGSSELIKNNGYVVSVRDSEGIRQSIEKYMESAELFKIHGMKSREIASTMSWENVAERYLDLYSKIQ